MVDGYPPERYHPQDTKPSNERTIVHLKNFRKDPKYQFRFDPLIMVVKLMFQLFSTELYIEYICSVFKEWPSLQCSWGIGLISFGSTGIESRTSPYIVLCFCLPCFHYPKTCKTCEICCPLNAILSKANYSWRGLRPLY